MPDTPERGPVVVFRVDWVQPREGARPVDRTEYHDTEQAAEAFAAALTRRGITHVYVYPVNVWETAA